MLAVVWLVGDRRFDIEPSGFAGKTLVKRPLARVRIGVRIAIRVRVRVKS